MEYIQNLFDLAQDYWLLTILVGLFSAFIESFLPVLPLVAIVTANAAIFGLWIGLILSWIGSGLGTSLLFLIVSKSNNNKFFNKFKNEKTEKAIVWAKNKGFKLLFIAYACPFVPGCLVTLASAFCERDKKTFLTSMLSGKFVMFLVVSYIGSDINGFITNPIKILVFSLLVFLSWEIGNRINLSLEEHDQNEDTIRKNN